MREKAPSHFNRALIIFEQLLTLLADAHTHFTWNGGDLNRLGELGVEEHVLLTARSAQWYIDSGYTM